MFLRILRNMNPLKKKLLFGTIALVFALIGVTGYFAAKNAPSVLREVKEIAAAPERVTLTTLIVLRYRYTLCGHLYSDEHIADAEINFDKTALSEYYKDFRIVSMSQGKAVLERAFALYCQRHLILKLEGEEVSILKTIPKTSVVGSIYSETIEPELLGFAETQELTAGKVFPSYEKIVAFLAEVRLRKFAG